MAISISFVALVTLVSYGNEPNKMTDLIIFMSGNLLILLIAPTPSHGRKWLAMIRDTCAGWPRPAASPRAADVDRCHRHCCCPPRLHRAMTTATLAIAAVSAVASVAPSSSLLLLLLWMPFPLEAEASTAVFVPSMTAAYPAPRNQNGGRRWLLAHTSMAMVHIFVLTLTPPPLLSSSPLFSSLSWFLQSSSPPPPVTVAAVDVHVDLHNHPLQQPLARDRRFHRPPPRVQGHEGRYQVNIVGGQAITMSLLGGGCCRCWCRCRPLPSPPSLQSPSPVSSLSLLS